MKFKKPFDKSCLECGCTFKARTEGKKYCTPKCCNKAWNHRNRYVLAEKRHERLRSEKYAQTGSPLYAPKIILNQALVFKD